MQSPVDHYPDNLSRYRSHLDIRGLSLLVASCHPESFGHFSVLSEFSGLYFDLISRSSTHIQATKLTLQCNKKEQFVSTFVAQMCDEAFI